MAAEPLTLRPDGRPVGSRGVSFGTILIALGIIALLAVAGFVVLSARASHAMQTDVVTSASSSLAAGAASR